MKVPVISLCVQAGVGTRTYHDAMAGTYVATTATLAKLNAALSRFKLAYGGDKGPMSVHAAYRLALVLAAGHLKADAKAVMAADPAKRLTRDPEWLAGSRVRWLAFWICNVLVGFRQSEVARAASVTRQAVCDAIKEVEDDETLARIRAELEEVFS